MVQPTTLLCNLYRLASPRQLINLALKMHRTRKIEKRFWSIYTQTIKWLELRKRCRCRKIHNRRQDRNSIFRKGRRVKDPKTGPKRGMAAELQIAQDYIGRGKQNPSI